MKSGLSHGMMRRDRENEAAPFRVCGNRSRLEIQGDGHMLDDLIELALELIFEGAMESAHARRKPLYARLALGAGLIVWLVHKRRERRDRS